MKIQFLTCLIILGLIQAAYGQQDVQFSQYVFDGLTLNPAYAGYKGDPYLNTTFRDQWTGFPGAPKTAMLSFDGLTNVPDEKMGLGLQVMYDQLGPQQNLSLTGSYSYRILLNNNEDDPHRLCLGVGAVASQYSLNGSVLQYEDPGDPEIPAVNVHSKIVPDANFGVYYYSNRFYAGGSMMNLFSLNSTRTIYYASGSAYASLLQGANVYLTAGGMLDISDEVKFKPSIMIKEDFKGPTNADLNVFFLFDEIFWVGGSYRTSAKLWNQSNLQQGLQAADAASLMIEFYATPELRIGYAYDFTTSGLSNYQTGSHELSLGISFKTKKNRQYLLSPRYF
jgi:type IX secretion system PorP/SprF family membrane protein